MESNLSSVDLDPSLRQAYEAAKDSQTITPILKEELKLTILNRRYKSGKGEINLDEKKPVVKRELTEEEITKKLRRKEQNRRAAERCRVKKKKLNDQLAIDFINEQKKTSQLEAELQALKKEKEMLVKMLEDHAFTCARAVTPSPSYDENTTFFGGQFTCQTTCMPNEMAGTFVRDTATPFSDPFDEHPLLNQENDFLMYPGILPFGETKGAYLPTTLPVDDLPEVQIPDDFSVFTPVSPVSPDVPLGRQSISDFIDEENFNN